MSNVILKPLPEWARKVTEKYRPGIPPLFESEPTEKR